MPAVLYCDAGHMLLGRRGTDGILTAEKYTSRGCGASLHSHVLTRIEVEQNQEM